MLAKWEEGKGSLPEDGNSTSRGLRWHRARWDRSDIQNIVLLVFPELPVEEFFIYSFQKGRRPGFAVTLRPSTYVHLSF